MFARRLGDPTDLAFPIRNWKEKRLKDFTEFKFRKLLLDTLINVLLGKKPLLELSTEMTYEKAVEIINIGIGYAKEVDSVLNVELVEEALVESLWSLFEPDDFAKALISEISKAVNSVEAGFRFEVLILLNVYYEAKRSTEKVTLLYGSLVYNLQKFKTTSGWVILMPDNLAGPDLIARAPDGTYRFYQVKFSKGIDLQGAMRTTDMSYLYCSRKKEMEDPTPLKGYEKHSSQCKEFFKGKRIERFVVYQGEKDISKHTFPDVTVITKKTAPKFFEGLGVNTTLIMAGKDDAIAALKQSVMLDNPSDWQLLVELTSNKE
ncbi:hypothetical protein HDU96_007029 [Phlyctochytrium bullatum]|nr:hypothetical protein HDU96_007029 [Phlyctochytrium bullatum]